MWTVVKLVGSFAGSIFLICKGAETAIFEKVVKGDMETIEQHINNFAKVWSILVVVRLYVAIVD